MKLDATYFYSARYTSKLAFLFPLLMLHLGLRLNEDVVHTYSVPLLFMRSGILQLFVLIAGLPKSRLSHLLACFAASWTVQQYDSCFGRHGVTGSIGLIGSTGSILRHLSCDASSRL